MIFSSDNAVGAPPEILEAIAAANRGGMASYGADPIAARVDARMSEIFETPVRTFFVATGTAANALALAAYAPPWGSVYCHAQAHIEADECGAPEFFSGARLALIDGEDGRIDPAALSAALAAAPVGDVHSVQPAMLSLSNVTESGTLYSVAQTTDLCAIARDYGLRVHLDGARFANAVAATNAAPADLTWRAGVDVLAFGGAKVGALGVEAVVFLHPERDAEAIRGFEFRRKRAGHLLSKGRLFSSQFDALLTDDLWLRLGRRANDSARRLAAAVAAIPGARALRPVEANMVFAGLPPAAHEALTAAGARYYGWPNPEASAAGLVPVRLVCSWATEQEEIDALRDIAAHAAAG